MPIRRTFSKRNLIITQLRRNGHTLQTIATRFNLTRERIRQIVNHVECIVRFNCQNEERARLRSK
jgi:DNA-directed RNA polymerase sigma subunit (sigma70/sigma32)